MNPIQQLLQSYGIHAEHLPTFAGVADYRKASAIAKKLKGVHFRKRTSVITTFDTLHDLSKRSTEIVKLVKTLKKPTIRFEDTNLLFAEPFPTKRITITTATGKYSGIITIDAYNQIINSQKQ